MDLNKAPHKYTVLHYTLQKGEFTTKYYYKTINLSYASLCVAGLFETCKLIIEGGANVNATDLGIINNCIK